MPTAARPPGRGGGRGRRGPGTPAARRPGSARPGSRGGSRRPRAGPGRGRRASAAPAGPGTAGRAPARGRAGPRPVARVAADAGEGGAERGAGSLQRRGEAAVEEDQPAREPVAGVRRVGGADDAEDRLERHARRRPADIDDALEQLEASGTRDVRGPESAGGPMKYRLTIPRSPRRGGKIAREPPAAICCRMTTPAAANAPPFRAGRVSAFTCARFHA